MGAGLVGWTLSAMALKQGRNVLLLERSARIGGRSSPESRQGFSFGSGLVWGSDSSAWQAIAQELELGLEWAPVASGGALVQSTKGWQALEAKTSLSNPMKFPLWEEYAASTVSSVLIGGANAYLQRLKQYCEAKAENFYFGLESPVEEIWTDQTRVSKLVLGSGQEIVVKDCIWTGDSKALTEAFRGEAIPEAGVPRVAWMKKFVKTDRSPAVILEFSHKNQVADFTESLVMPFNVAEKEERRFLIGSFISQRDPSLAPPAKQLSSWICPLTELEWGDNHETMKKIRAAKRLLEKAFPNFATTVTDERVLVLEHSFTPVGKRKGEWQAVLPNLKVVTDWSSPYGSHWQGILELIQQEKDAIFTADNR